VPLDDPPLDPLDDPPPDFGAFCALDDRLALPLPEDLDVFVSAFLEVLVLDFLDFSGFFSFSAPSSSSFLFFGNNCA